MSLYAQEKGTPMTEDEKSKASENVLVPSPAEAFKALDKLTEVDWKHIVSYNKNSNYSNDYLRALNLGARVADGFIAIQAQDSKNLKEMATVIKFLGRKLGVHEVLLQKGDTIEEHAKQGQWIEVLQTLEGLRDDVLNEIDRLNEPDMATLAIAGGWLEGLHVVCKALTDNYNEEASTILYQPDLIEHFISELNELSDEAKEEDVVKQIFEKMGLIKQLVSVGWKKPVPKDKVENLNRISSELIEAIERG